MTKEEIRREIKEINQRMKEMKHTRPKLIAECSKILASNDLNDTEKAAHVSVEAESYMEDNSHRFQEMRKIEAMQQKMWDEHSGTSQRPTYCPTCNEWYPSAPPKMEALYKQWRNAFIVLRDKIAVAILKGKAADP
jgi:hypothetical protein